MSQQSWHLWSYMYVDPDLSFHLIWSHFETESAETQDDALNEGVLKISIPTFDPAWVVWVQEEIEAVALEGAGCPPTARASAGVRGLIQLLHLLVQTLRAKPLLRHANRTSDFSRLQRSHPRKTRSQPPKIQLNFHVPLELDFHTIAPLQRRTSARQ